MKKRLQKKLHLGRYRQWHIDFTCHLQSKAIDVLYEDLIIEMETIEVGLRGLFPNCTVGIGGRILGPWIGYLSSARRSPTPRAEMELARMFLHSTLAHNPLFVFVDVGSVVDAWGWSVANPRVVHSRATR
jgi:uncharacterized protein YggL (DUF469 family)